MTRAEAVTFLADSVRRTLIWWKGGWSAAAILEDREQCREGYSSPTGIFYNFGSAGTWRGDKRLKGQRGHVLIGRGDTYYFIPFQDILDAVEGKPQQLRLF